MTLFSETLLRSTDGPSLTPWMLFRFVVDAVTAGAATAGLPFTAGRGIEEVTAGAAVA